MEAKLIKKMASASEIAEMFSLSTGTLGNWRSQKKGPAFYRARRKVLYSIEEVDRWIKSQMTRTIDCR